MTEPVTAPTQAPDPAAVPLYGPRFQRNPAEVYQEIRRDHGPVAPVLLEGDVPAWLVLGYREVRQVTDNPQLFARDSRRWNAWDRIPPDWPLLTVAGHQPSVMFAEGDEHRRRAGAISDALAAVDQFELRTVAERLADDLVDGFCGSGAADLMSGYAHPLPLLVTARLFGLPEERTPELVRDMTAAMNGDVDAGAAHQRTIAMMQRLVLDKRERPGPDMPSRMLAASAEATPDGLALDLLVVMFASQQTTADWIGNALRLMLTDRRFAVSLTGGRRSVGQALNEVLWADTPTQNYLGRWAVRDTRLGGRHIRTGDALVLGLAAANTDPQMWPESEIGAGGNQAQMSFSHGEHGCPHPAPELAEVVAKAAVEVILDRLPDVALAVPPDELDWRPSVWMRGLNALPVEFTPAYVA